MGKSRPSLSKKAELATDSDQRTFATLSLWLLVSALAGIAFFSYRIYTATQEIIIPDTASSGQNFAETNPKDDQDLVAFAAAYDSAVDLLNKKNYKDALPKFLSLKAHFRNRPLLLYLTAFTLRRAEGKENLQAKELLIQYLHTEAVSKYRLSAFVELYAYLMNKKDVDFLSEQLAKITEESKRVTDQDLLYSFNYAAADSVRYIAEYTMSNGKAKNDLTQLRKAEKILRDGMVFGEKSDVLGFILAQCIVEIVGREAKESISVDHSDRLQEAKTLAEKYGTGLRQKSLLTQIEKLEKAISVQ